MEVGDGSKTPNCINDTTLRTRVVLVCNSSAQWTSENLTDFAQVGFDDHNSCSVSSVCVLSVRMLCPRHNILQLYITSERKTVIHDDYRYGTANFNNSF